MLFKVSQLTLIPPVPTFDPGFPSTLFWMLDENLLLVNNSVASLQAASSLSYYYNNLL